MRSRKARGASRTVLGSVLLLSLGTISALVGATAQQAVEGPAVQEAAVDTPMRAGAAEDPRALIRYPEGPIYRVPIEGVIELGLAPFVERSIREAASAEASVVILDVDTPGGRVDAAERIADAVSDSEIPVFAFVNRRAISAGALISLAADGIYMRPGASMGAATPVDATGEVAPEKIVSAMRSAMRSLAEARGLNPAVAEAMVDPDIEIPGVVEAGRLLTLTPDEAVAVGYAGFVETWDALLAQLGIEGNEVVVTEVNWAERTVRFLSHPVVAPFLLSLGFLGLLVEIKTPGFGLAGAAGVLSLALFFGSHLIIGLAGWEGLMIFGLGAVLVLVEVFLIPGMGVFGIVGGLTMLVGIFLSLLGGLPTATDFGRAGSVLSTSLVIVLITSWLLVRRLPENRRLTSLGIFLGTATGRETGYISQARRPELVGWKGVAITDLRPAGTGLFGDERLDVVSEQEWIEEGSPIEIVFSEGYRHVVRRVRAPSPAAGPEVRE